MKNRKRIITAFVFLAFMLVGVGYAAVTNTLDIGGSSEVTTDASQKAFNQDIYFEGVVVDTQVVANTTTLGEAAPKDYTANINSNNNDKAQFTVTGLEGKGDSITIVFRLANNGDLDADLKMQSCTNDNTAYFDVKYYLLDGNTNPEIDTADKTTVFYTLAGKANETDPANTVDIKVVVTLKETPTTHQAMTTTFVFNATSDDTVGA